MALRTLPLRAPLLTLRGRAAVPNAEHGALAPAGAAASLSAERGAWRRRMRQLLLSCLERLLADRGAAAAERRPLSPRALAAACSAVAAARPAAGDADSWVWARNGWLHRVLEDVQFHTSQVHTSACGHEQPLQVEVMPAPVPAAALARPADSANTSSGTVCSASNSGSNSHSSSNNTNSRSRSGSSSSSSSGSSSGGCIRLCESHPATPFDAATFLVTVAALRRLRAHWSPARGGGGSGGDSDSWRAAGRPSWALPLVLCARSHVGARSMQPQQLSAMLGAVAALTAPALRGAHPDHAIAGEGAGEDAGKDPGSGAGASAADVSPAQRRAPSRDALLLDVRGGVDGRAELAVAAAELSSAVVSRVRELSERHAAARAPAADAAVAGARGSGRHPRRLPRPRAADVAALASAAVSLGAQLPASDAEWLLVELRRALAAMRDGPHRNDAAAVEPELARMATAANADVAA
eukprot:151744-Chlamydomonas_euryale.AAC.1